MRCGGLGDLAARSDVITLHLPLNEQTRHLVDDAFLARVRPGAVLVNCSRGGLIDTDAVWWALMDGRLSGSASTCSTPSRPAAAAGPPPRRRPDPAPDGAEPPGHRGDLYRRRPGVLDVLSGREPRAVADPGWRAQCTKETTHDHRY